MLVGRIGLIHEGKTAALGSGVGVSSFAPPRAHSPFRPRAEEGEAGRRQGGGGQAGRKPRPDQTHPLQQGDGYARSRSPITAHTGEVQTKCPPHIGKSGQRLYQGAQNFIKAFGHSDIQKNFMRPNDRIFQKKSNKFEIKFYPGIDIK